MKRLLIVANPDKPNVAAAVAELQVWLKGRATVVGVETDHTHDLTTLGVDFILVLGGDGTLLSTARRLAGRQIPLMGVNFGRLGFLAGFTPQNYQFYLALHLEDRPVTFEREDAWSAGLPIRPRMMLEASVLPAGIDCSCSDVHGLQQLRSFAATALNDAVVTAGPPFHMIEMEITADGEAGIRYFGDGVIVATSSGSTAYNVSAGGPIINSDVEAFCITPICPHSLSFRPVVVSTQSTIQITASRVNEGTTLFCDGQASTKLLKGDRVIVRRSDHNVLLVENPDARRWRSLAEKLNWAISPKYNDER